MNRRRDRNDIDRNQSVGLGQHKVVAWTALTLQKVPSTRAGLEASMYSSKTKRPTLLTQKSGNPLSRGTGTGTGGAGGGAAKSSPMAASGVDAATNATGPASGGGTAP